MGVILMDNTMKKIECDPVCGFMVRSHDEKEIMGIALTHAKNVHQMNVSEKDMQKRLVAV